METIYDSWSDMAKPCVMDLWFMKWRSAWPIFHSPVILPYILKTFWCMKSLVGITSQYDQIFDLMINVGLCDVYFMVQWFCIIFWKLFDVWTSYCGIMGQYDPTFDLIINVGHCDLYFMVQWHETVWSKFWPQNKYKSTWLIFHGLVILLNIFKIIWWINIIVDLCDTKIDLIKYM